MEERKKAVKEEENNKKKTEGIQSFKHRKENEH